jgi:hypothetical protein
MSVSGYDALQGGGVERQIVPVSLPQFSSSLEHTTVDEKMIIICGDDVF